MSGNVYSLDSGAGGYGVPIAALVQEFILCSAEPDAQAGKSHQVPLGGRHGKAVEGCSVEDGLPGNQSFGWGFCPGAKVSGKFHPDGGVVRCATGSEGEDWEAICYREMEA